MAITDVWKLSKHKALIYDLKYFPDNIIYTYAPIMNSDMLQLIELSECMTKSEAIQFAVRFTIDNMKNKKLERLRYVQKEAHEASGELLDS